MRLAQQVDGAYSVTANVSIDGENRVDEIELESNWIEALMSLFNHICQNYRNAETATINFVVKDYWGKALWEKEYKKIKLTSKKAFIRKLLEEIN